jgi:hypothetical protein
MPESVRAGFRRGKSTTRFTSAWLRVAFKSMDAEYPLYGKHARPRLSPEQWWTELIRRCFKAAGADDAGRIRAIFADEHAKIPELDRFGKKASSALLDRFESDQGYRDFPETIETRMSRRQIWADKAVKALSALGVKTSVVSNADPRIREFNELPELTSSKDSRIITYTSTSQSPTRTVLGRGSVETLSSDI